VNFTPFSTPGTYRLYVPSWNAQSYDFKLDPNVYNEVGKAALKTFYYQRCGVAHSQPYAQAPWADPRVCHPYLTAATAATGEPDHGPLDLSGGWHDAGDYNKYVWGDLFLAMSTLMTAYESNPGVWGDGQLVIPGGGNGVPDIVDEIKVEIDWLLKMQLPNGDVLSRVWDDYAGAPDSAPRRTPCTTIATTRPRSRPRAFSPAASLGSRGSPRRWAIRTATRPRSSRPRF